MGIEDIEKKIDLLMTEKTKKPKEFKIPFFKRVNPTQAAKGWITLFKINENKYINLTKERIEEQTIMVDGIPRLALSKYIFYIKKNPVIFLPSWSVTPLTQEDFDKPFDVKEHAKISLEDGTNINGFKILLAAMKGSAINQKKPMSGVIKWIIGIGLAGIIGYALITGGK